MKLVLASIRVALALWVCVGVQLHIGLEHTALHHHLQDHAETAQADHCRSDRDSAPESGATICCLQSSNHHHDHHAPHSHQIEATTGPSPQRLNQPLHAEFVSTIALQPVSPVARFVAPGDEVTASDPGLARDIAPRAPPAA